MKPRIILQSNKTQHYLLTLLAYWVPNILDLCCSWNSRPSPLLFYHLGILIPQFSMWFIHSSLKASAETHLLTKLNSFSVKSMFLLYFFDLSWQLSPLTYSNNFFIMSHSLVGFHFHRALFHHCCVLQIHEFPA